MKNGDIIRINIPEFKLEVDLTKKEIASRLAALPKFEPRVKKGYLSYYTEKVSSASTGAVFK